MGLDLLWLVAALGLFVGSHFLLSHPLRAPLVRAMKTKPFLAFYSLIAIVTLSLTALAFSRAPATPELWDGHGIVPWVLASVLTIFATALFLPSILGNPALPGAQVAGLSAYKPRGVFLVTRHPMMHAFALWGVAHILVAPTPRTIALAVGMIVLALVGAWLQDGKKVALHDREWRAWMKRTTFWPDMARLDKLGAYWPAAFIVWGVVTWAHIPLADEPAGLWRWVEVAHNR